MAHSTDLERNDDDEDLALLAGQDMLDEGPARADEGQHGEEQSALQPEGGRGEG